LRYPTPAALPYSYYGELLEYSEYTLADHAIPSMTPRQQPRGPLVAPGKYTVELRYEGKTQRQPLVIEIDPRVHASQQDLTVQRDLALEIVRGMKSSYDGYHQIATFRKALTERAKTLHDDSAKKSADDLQKQLDALEKGTRKAPGVGPVNRDLARLLFSVENADMRPAETVNAAVEQSCHQLETDLTQWRQFNQRQVPAFNQVLAGAKLPPIQTQSVTVTGCKP
jgi:hypothetical protein